MEAIKDAETLLAYLRSLDIKISAEGDRLKVDAPKGSLSSELRTLLTAHKADLIQLYRQQQATVRHPNGYRPIQPVDRGRRLDASFAQQRLWFLDRLEENSQAYTIPLFLRATGKLHRDALRQALAEIVRRHEVLRTVFAPPEGEDKAPYQVILPPFSIDTPVIDLTDLPEADREAKIQTIAHETATQPFDLSTGPLISLTIVRAKAQAHVLLFTMHHIIFDGLSVAIFLRELKALYAAFVRGKPTPLAALEIQYADFSLWQKQQLTGHTLDEYLQFWQAHLADAPPLLELPTDRPRPPIQTFRGARAHFTLHQDLTQRLRTLSRAHNATLFMTLYAAFAALIARYTGQEDIVIGTPIANRNHPQTEALIGFFINTLALRCQVAQDLPFTELLQRVKATARQAYQHQDLPFEKLINELNVERSLAHNPLFQIMFSFQEARAGEFTLPNLTLSPYLFDYTVSKFDLTLIIHEAPETLSGIVEYNTDLFEAATIERMMRHFQVLVQGIVEHPSAPVAQLPLLTQAERHQLLVEFNDTAVDYPRDKCVHQLFEAQAEKTPHAVAVVFEDAQITYWELNARANQLAHYLQGLGVGSDPAGDTLIGICMARSIEMIVGLLGILKAGGAYVPLDPEYPADRLTFMLKDSRMKVLLLQNKTMAHVVTDQAHFVNLDTDKQIIAQQATHNLGNLVAPSQLAYVLYTSGSTGVPKGVAIEHHSPVALIAWAQRIYDPEQLAGVLAATSICFDLSVYEIFLPLSVGGTIILAQTVMELSTLRQRESVTLLNTVPSAMKTLLNVDTMPASVQTVNLAGEPLSRALVDQLYSLQTVEKVYDLYGPSEDTTYSTFALRQRAGSNTIGKPIDNTQIYILDQNLQPQPIGIPGELHISGAGLARGYLNQPVLSAERFMPNPFQPESDARLYKTGDWAKWLPDGNIEFLGRIDYQVKVRGFRIELGEIEALLAKHPAVKESVIVVRQTVVENEQLIAYVVSTRREDQADGQAAQLKDYLKQKLPDYMIPGLISFLDALPLTPNGKIDRKSLPEPDLAHRRQGYVAPRDTLELQLALLWETILGLSSVSVLDNFFELGGDSLLAIRLISNISQKFGVKIPLHTLFQSGTVEQLASVLRRDGATATWSPLVCLQPQGTKPPFFCVHAAGGIVFRYLQVAALLGKARPFYGLQARGVEPGDAFYASIEAMAADYVTAVRSVQPKGPYLLAGWSFGGTVAFEMARILEQAGEAVPYLMMIDAPSPFVDIYAENPEDDVEFWVERLRFAAGLKLEKLDLQTSREAQLAYLFNEQRLAGLFAPDIDHAYAQHRLNLHKHHNQILCQYRPAGPFDGKIIFFKPTEQIPFDTKMKDPIPAWERFARNGLEVHDAPGNHFTMFSPVNGPLLAKNLKTCIETFESELSIS